MSNSAFSPASSEAAPSSALYAERATLPPLPPEPSLWESLRIQLRVIGALLLRESLTRFGRRNLGFLWLFAEPMLFTLGVTVLFNLMGAHKGEGVSITAFVLTGYSTVLLWRNMPMRCVSAIPPNAALLYHRQVKPIDIYVARCALEAAGATMSFIILGVIFTSFGLVPPPHDILKVLGAWLLLMWYAFSISLLVGTLSERSDVVEKLWHPLTYIMVPLSGSFFMVHYLPSSFHNAVLWFPSVSCVELLREGYFHKAVVAYYDIGYVITFNLTVLFLAFLQLRIISRNITPH